MKLHIKKVTLPPRKFKKIGETLSKILIIILLKVSQIYQFNFPTGALNNKFLLCIFIDILVLNLFFYSLSTVSINAGKCLKATNIAISV